MRKSLFVLLLTVLVAGCFPQTEESEVTPAPTYGPLRGTPIPVALSELAANPTIFEGAYIRLTGRYKPLPVLICESKKQPSPATWGLSSDTLLALAGGFDGQLRPLLPIGLDMTIAGRWLHWEGVVGCGNKALPQDIWYLETAQILSPNPIAGIPLTQDGQLVLPDTSPPGNEATANAQAGLTRQPGEGTTEPPIFATAPTPSPSPPSNRPGIPTPTTNGSFPTPTAQTTSIVSTNTPIPGGNGSTATPTSTIHSSPNPTNTPRPGTNPTTGPTPTTGILGTSTPSSKTNVDMGFLEPELLEMRVINGDERHQWTFSNDTANNTLTVYAIAVDSVNITVSISDPSGTILDSQNSTGPGLVEAIADLALPQLGEYQIELSSANNQAGEYALIAVDDASFPISFHKISYDSSVFTEFNENSEQIWFFTGSANDVINITAVPNSIADIGIEFIGPGAETLEDLDQNFEGETEQLLNYSLDSPGLYGLWLYGISDGLIQVDLLVEKN